MTRKTSSYLILIVTQEPNALDNLVVRCRDIAPVETTSQYTGMVGLRFRCTTNDDLATSVAAQIAEGKRFRLLTGYGVNQREIVQ